eukprot:jgi/Mesen1/9289/ME000060S08726
MMTLSSVLLVIAVALGAILVADPYKLSPIADVNFTPHPITVPVVPHISDKSNSLNSSAAELLYVGEIFGPESLAFDSEGRLYTGLGDGRIVRRDPGSSGAWETFAWTSPKRTAVCEPETLGPNLAHEEQCGRPLGLRFDKKTGDLWIADAYFGLMKVGPQGGLAESLATQAEGVPFYFTNDLDIDDDGSVYFTDTSTKYRRRQFLLEILEGGSYGRLLKYSPTTGVATTLLSGLSFANGVALSKNRDFLVVCETTIMRCQRYWLKGAKAGTAEVFINLPGFPDNIRLNPEGHFWIAIHSRRNSLIEWMGRQPWARKALLSLPLSTRVVYAVLLGMPKGMVMKVDKEGQVQEVLEDVKGSKVRAVSEVEEHAGQLWMGSVLMPHIARYLLPKAAP